jgi:dienelactone hydrolase
MGSIHDAMAWWRKTWIKDATAASDYLTNLEDVLGGSISVGGASCGGFVALELARGAAKITSMVLLGGPVDDRALSSLSGDPGIPVFGAISAEDITLLQGMGVKSTRDVIDSSRNPKSKLYIYRDAGHGVGMFLRL